MSSSQVFSAGEFWLFGEPGAEGRRLNVHELLAQGIQDARNYLRGQGYSDDETAGPLPGLNRAMRGSAEEVAFGLIAAGRSCMAVLSMARRDASNLDIAALATAEFGMRYAIFQSMAGGLTAGASHSRASKRALSKTREVHARDKKTRQAQITRLIRDGADEIGPVVRSRRELVSYVELHWDGKWRGAAGATPSYNTIDKVVKALVDAGELSIG